MTESRDRFLAEHLGAQDASTLEKRGNDRRSSVSERSSDHHLSAGSAIVEELARSPLGDAEIEHAPVKGPVREVEL